MKTIFSISIFLISQIYNAQNIKNIPCEQELATGKEMISHLQKDNLYFKDTLNLLKPIKSTKIDGLQIDIVKAIGSKKDMTLNLEFIYKNINTENRKYFQCSQASVIDPQGNHYKTYQVIVGSDKDVRIENISPNLPHKGKIQFKVSEVDFPVIKELKIKFYANDPLKFTSVQSAVFENINVTWN